VGEAQSTFQPLLTLPEMRAVSDTRVNPVTKQLESWPAAQPKSSFGALEVAIERYRRLPDADEVRSTSASQPELPFRRAILAGALIVAAGIGWADGWTSHRFYTLASAGAVPGSECRHPSCKRAASSPKSDPALTTANTSKRNARDVEPVRSAAPTTRAVATVEDTAKRTTMPVPETKPMTIEAWAVREVVVAKAILDGPNGIFHVRGGDAVPGVGRVDSLCAGATAGSLSRQGV
jgi:hypothetical protein